MSVPWTQGSSHIVRLCQSPVHLTGGPWEHPSRRRSKKSTRFRTKVPFFNVHKGSSHLSYLRSSLTPGGSRQRRLSRCLMRQGTAAEGQSVKDLWRVSGQGRIATLGPRRVFSVGKSPNPWCLTNPWKETSKIRTPKLDPRGVLTSG